MIFSRRTARAFCGVAPAAPRGPRYFTNDDGTRIDTGTPGHELRISAGVVWRTVGDTSCSSPLTRARGGLRVNFIAGSADNFRRADIDEPLAPA